MVGEEEHLPGPPGEPLAQRAEELGIEALEGLDLAVDVALVSGFVGGLDVDDAEVVLAQRHQGGLGLGLVVGVVVAGGAGHVDHLEPRQHAEPAHEVDGGDERAARSVSLLERRQLGLRSLAPEPDLGGRSLPLLLPLFVDRVLGQHLDRLVHELLQRLGRRPFGHELGHLLADDVVRRCALGLAHLRRPHHDVPVLHSRMECDRATQGVLQGANQLGRLLRADVAGGEVLHDALVDGNEVAPKGDLAVLQLDPHGRRLDRGSAAPVLGRVEAEGRHAADVGSGVHAVGNGAGATHLAGECHGPQVHEVGGGQRRAAVEIGVGMVGGAVGDYQQVLHGPRILGDAARGPASAYEEPPIRGRT